MPDQAPAADALTPPALPQPFSSILQGTPPAVSLPPEKANETNPLSDFVQQHLQDLLTAGIGVFESKDLYSVFYNPSRLSHEDLQKADNNGTLMKVAPPIDTKALARAAAPKAPPAPAPLAQQATQAPDAAPAGNALASAQAAPANAPKGNSKLLAARLQQLKTKPGSSGPLDQLSKRAF